MVLLGIVVCVVVVVGVVLGKKTPLTGTTQERCNSKDVGRSFAHH